MAPSQARSCLPHTRQPASTILLSPFKVKGHINLDISPRTHDMIGSMKMEVENMNSPVPVPCTRLRHTFLHMALPVHECTSQKTLEGGKIHRIPFKFVVPPHLPIQVCHHPCANCQVQQHHLQLPASLGNAGQFFDGAHDMSLDEAQVSYMIKFALWQRDPHAKGCRARVMQEAAQLLYIIPTSQENPPLLVTPKSTWYQLHTENTLTKGVLRSAVGTLTASTTQPPAIELRYSSRRRDDSELSTAIRIELRFEPTHPSQSPPRFLSSRLKLKAWTFFGLEPWQDLPDHSSTMNCSFRHAVWSHTVPLSSTPAVLDWRTCMSPTGNGRGSGMVYTASLDTAVALPSQYVYPPTFHSCFISRVYSLKVSFLYQAHTSTQKTSSISLNVPVQIFAS